MSFLHNHTKLLSNNLRDGQSSQRRHPYNLVRAVILFIVGTVRGGSLNQMTVFQGGHIGQGALSIVPFGPNTHYMLCDHCLREAGAGGSNPLTPTSHFNDLAAFTDLLIPHLAHCCSSDEGLWRLYIFSGYLLVVYPSSLIAITNQNATYLTAIYVILNPVRIAAYNAVINLNIMTVKLIVYLQIKLEGFKAEIARD